MITKASQPTMVSKDKRKTVGHKLSSAEREDVFIKLFDMHVVGGMSLSRCAHEIGLHPTTVKNYFRSKTKDNFTDWLKNRQPSRFDRDYVINRFLERSEQRRTYAMGKLTQTNELRHQVNLLKEIREEDNDQLRVMQDIGVVEKQAEATMGGVVKFQWDDTPEKTVRKK